MPDQPQQPPVTSEHFRILRLFVINRDVRNFPEEHREHVWRICLNSAGLPVLPLEKVREEWRRFAAAGSKESTLAINGDVDPNFVSIAICYRNVSQAGHTVRTRALLKKLLSIYAKAHPSPNDFLTAVQQMCNQVLTGGRP